MSETNVTVNVEFILLARSLRLKQREYFNNKSRSLLVECKQLERQFDGMLKSILDVIEQSEKERSAIEHQRRLL